MCMLFAFTWFVLIKTNYNTKFQMKNKKLHNELFNMSSKLFYNLGKITDSIP